jgi:MFS family permease
VKDADYQKNSSFCECVINEPCLVINDLKVRSLRLLSYSFTLWEISLYCILILYADFNNLSSPFVGVAMMFGYIFGSCIMKLFTKISNKTMIKLGYIISLLSLMPYMILSVFVENVYYLLVGGYFFHAIGNAILCPTLLSIVSRGIDPRHKGKRFGILESFDTIAFLISAIIIMVYKFLNLKIIYLVILSFLTIVISLVPYKKFEKLCGDSVD